MLDDVFYITFLSYLNWLMMALCTRAETCCNKTYQYIKSCDWQLLSLRFYILITTDVPLQNKNGKGKTAPVHATKYRYSAIPKETAHSTHWTEDWVGLKSASGQVGNEKIHLSPLGIELRSLGCPAGSIKSLPV